MKRIFKHTKGFARTLPESTGEYRSIIHPRLMLQKLDKMFENFSWSHTWELYSTSEYTVLWILWLVKTGKIKIEELELYYCNSKGILTIVPVDTDGNFDVWPSPYGFYCDRLKLLR